jgi:DNA invertase Pin-like site-specific DNA recombinase
MIRVYLRCSTEDQTVASQRHALKNWIALQAPESPTKWYEDEGFTGSNGDRPAYQRLMKEVKASDTVLCFAVDRMSREGIVATLQLRQTLNAKGAKLVSVSEPWLSDDNPASEIVTAVLAWAAEQERKRILARQRAGIQAAKAAGKTWGGRKAGTRISLTAEKEALCHKLKTEGQTVASIARNLGIARKTVYVALERREA